MLLPKPQAARFRQYPNYEDLKKSFPFPIPVETYCTCNCARNPPPIATIATNTVCAPPLPPSPPTPRACQRCRQPPTLTWPIRHLNEPMQGRYAGRPRQTAHPCVESASMLELYDQIEDAAAAIRAKLGRNAPRRHHPRHRPGQPRRADRSRGVARLRRDPALSHDRPPPAIAAGSSAARSAACRSWRWKAASTCTRATRSSRSRCRSA